MLPFDLLNQRMVNMPFEKARLFELVRGRRLPDFARELGITSWAQFF
jgi:hypothetical protein